MLQIMLSFSLIFPEAWKATESLRQWFAEPSTSSLHDMLKVLSALRPEKGVEPGHVMHIKHTYIPTHIHTYIPTYVRTYVRTYIHIYIYIYIYICTLHSIQHRVKNM